MRSPLLQFQTPTAPRRVSRFFRVWLLSELPRLADHSAYFGLAKFYLSQPFQPSTETNLNSYLIHVNAILTAIAVICGSCCGKASSIAEITTKTCGGVAVARVRSVLRSTMPGLCCIDESSTTCAL